MMMIRMIVIPLLVASVLAALGAILQSIPIVTTATSRRTSEKEEILSQPTTSSFHTNNKHNDGVIEESVLSTEEKETTGTTIDVKTKQLTLNGEVQHPSYQRNQFTFTSFPIIGTNLATFGFDTNDDNSIIENDDDHQSTSTITIVTTRKRNEIF